MSVAFRLFLSFTLYFRTLSLTIYQLLLFKKLKFPNLRVLHILIPFLHLPRFTIIVLFGVLILLTVVVVLALFSVPLSINTSSAFIVLAVVSSLSISFFLLAN